MANPLPPRREAFVREYLVDLNAAQAAIRAGYSRKTAEKIGWELLQQPEVRAAIDAAKAARASRVELKADDVLRELLAIARADLSEAFDEAGAVKKLRDIPAEVRRALAAYEPGEWGVRLKFWDKTRALELLAKHLKLLTDKVEHSGSIESMTDEQLEARFRALTAKAPK